MDKTRRPVTAGNRAQAMMNELGKLKNWLERTEQGHILFRFGPGGVSIETKATREIVE